MLHDDRIMLMDVCQVCRVDSFALSQGCRQSPVASDNVQMDANPCKQQIKVKSWAVNDRHDNDLMTCVFNYVVLSTILKVNI